MNLKAFSRVNPRIALSVAGLVAGIVLSAIAVSRTQAGPTPHKDYIKCQKLQNVCSTSCADSTYNGVGVCRDQQTGSEVVISIECCCCADGYQNRVWIP